jgi:hypothetical protein
MNQIQQQSDPLDTIIDFAWSTGADKFWINNAKDELKRLREKIYEYEQLLSQPVAYTKMNENGDIYDLNINYNPYLKLYPLYMRTEHAEQRKQAMQSKSKK